ncbi:hypothetical protein ACVXZ4_07335 [Lacisediminihabitans sp. FW035]
MTTPIIDSAPISTGTAPVTPVDTTRTLGITSLVLGLASIAFGYTVLVPIAAIVIGAVGLSHEPAGRSYSVWGIIVGAVSLALPAIALLFGLAFLAPFGLFALVFGQ